MSRFLNKTKPMTQKVMSATSEEECSSCRARGRVSCSTCQSKGFVKKFRTEQLGCEVCDSTGRMTAPCLECSGRGTSSRSLRYEDKGGQGAIDQRGILFGAKRTQVVSVLVKNTDEVAGKYQVHVTLRDGKSTRASASVTLRPGETAPVSLSFFPISSKEGYPASYEIIPEEVETSCTICLSKGKTQRTCLACQGVGQAASQRQVAEICSSCSGAGEVKCAKCSGEGRIRAQP